MNWFLTINWKTSLIGFIAGIPAIAKVIWPDIPDGAVQFLQGIAIIALGIVAKDGNVSGSGGR